MVLLWSDSLLSLVTLFSSLKLTILGLIIPLRIVVVVSDFCFDDLDDSKELLWKRGLIGSVCSLVCMCRLLYGWFKCLSYDISVSGEECLWVLG